MAHSVSAISSTLCGAKVAIAETKTGNEMPKMLVVVVAFALVALAAAMLLAQRRKSSGRVFLCAVFLGVFAFGCALTLKLNVPRSRHEPAPVGAAESIQGDDPETSPQVVLPSEKVAMPLPPADLPSQMAMSAKIVMPPLYAPHLVERAWRNLQWGSVAFNTPAKIFLKHSERVSVAVSPQLSPADLETLLREQLGPRSEDGERIKISNRMRAELIGPGFTITPLAPEEQGVRVDEPTYWRWTITPTRSGDHSLHLNIYAVLGIPDVSSNRDVQIVLKTYDKKIVVEIGIMQRVTSLLREYWQWVFASILIPVVKLMMERRGKQSLSKPPSRFGERLRRKRGLAIRRLPL
jgi:hypothetical protein